jgi:hypothetical protein
MMLEVVEVKIRRSMVSAAWWLITLTHFTGESAYTTLQIEV